MRLATLRKSKNKPLTFVRSPGSKILLVGGIMVTEDMVNFAIGRHTTLPFAFYILLVFAWAALLIRVTR